MPLKFKLYFACACYLLLWAVFWLTDNICDVIFKRNADASGNIMMMLAMLVIILIGGVPVKMIFHYRSSTHPTRNVKLLFIVSHGFNIGAVIVLFIISFIALLTGFVHGSDDEIYRLPTLSEYLSGCSIIVAFASCLTLLVVSPSLSKAVRDRYNAIHDIKIDF